jgi:hypothetical protein
MDEAKTQVIIVKIIYSDNSVSDSKKSPDQILRTKQWLDKMSGKMDFEGF